MSREVRQTAVRDPRLARASTVEVARRYRASSTSGSAVTLVILVVGLTMLGLPGAYVWAWSPAGAVVLLAACSLAIGAVAAHAPALVSGTRAIVIAAAIIVYLPAALAAIGAVLVDPAAREELVTAVGVTLAVGTVMLAAVAAGYAGASRRREARRGSLPEGGDRIATPVLAAVDATMREAITTADGRELTRRVVDDTAGRALLELETRWLEQAGYRELRRSRITYEETAADMLVGLGTGDSRVPRPSLEVGFARRADVYAGASESEVRDPLDGTADRATRPAPDASLAAEAARWHETQVVATAFMPPTTGWSGPGPLLRATVVLAVLAGQAIALVLALDAAQYSDFPADAEPLHLAVVAILGVLLPFVTGGAAGVLGGVRAWSVAAVPLLAAGVVGLMSPPRIAT